MNRIAGILTAAFVWGGCWSAPGDAQVPLVVGSVRDQQGFPVEGATVSALDAGGAIVESGVTDGTGTFSLPGSRAVVVSISCRYCLERRVPVAGGEPIVAIVRRFSVLIDDAPSPQDIENLPYAHIESAMALRPFTLLRQSSAVLPGPQLADRGFLPQNALLIDAGVPNYDVSFGASQYYAIPSRYEGAGNIASPASAFSYGDRAGSGIVTLDPFAGNRTGLLIAGGETAVGAQTDSPALQTVAGASGGAGESRQRFDGRWLIPLSAAQSLSLNGGSSRYSETAGDSTLNGNTSFAKAAFDDAQRTVDVHADFTADRSGYLAQSGGLPISTTWSDAQLSAGVRTNGVTSTFVNFSDRLSTGFYDAGAFAQPRLAGTLSQKSADAGIDTSGRWYDANAALGWFDIGYTGGSNGTSQPSSGQLATPSVSLRLFPDGKWSALAQASGGFALPNLWQQYSDYFNAGAFAYDRSTVYAATLSYTDDARLRASLQTASQRVSGNLNGLVTSSGLSFVWQVAPAIAVRAWTMYVDDATAPPAAGWPVAAGTPSTVDALWLTYENGANMRLDAVYRRDLLDGAAFEHLDASVSARLSGRVRWYAGVEDLRRTTYLSAGLLFNR